MPIVLYNTKTKKKDVFVPLIPAQVSMYVCGVTVYDDCHLGHARSALTFDMIRRAPVQHVVQSDRDGAR